ncbi:radical SAM protein [Halobacteriovorax sp. HLS]|uniref:radical SAM protein n=1 Tax=Halobacteriovorax sp. HLS TaxID=2234000 RepID=UPI000FD81C81|nr:radical SAM protein [Halobacteriovorax sp. HLS]
MEIGTPRKWEDLKQTAKGEQRAHVPFSGLKTLWFNTGTLCNLSCENCYIESSPTNDRLSYLSVEDVNQYLNEIKTNKWKLDSIGFTGGEPFLNPNIISILNNTLELDVPVLVLTNAYNVIKRWERPLLEMNSKFGEKLKMRVSLDHYTEHIHEQQRGAGTFLKSLASLKWLYDNGFNISIAGRSLIDETPQLAANGYQELMRKHQIDIELDSSNLVIFPEMKEDEDVPEISVGCWDILKVKPESQMCSSERMIVKRKGQATPSVLSCTLLAYDEAFEMGKTLKDSFKNIHLKHPFCSKFCVLGGASCSGN